LSWHDLTKHRDALTNFLSLVAQEAPEEATAKLETLAKKNPDFSAIPALLGGLYEQMGDPSRAIDSLIRAVRMEPDNLAYKYNLAVLYDKHGSAEDAIVLYNQLLAAGQSGLPLPAPIRDLQERVIYISSRSEG
jgi:tetratricopeptide (TPR) repeat protein